MNLVDRIIDGELDAHLGRRLYQEICRLDPSDDPAWEKLSERDRSMWALASVAVVSELESLLSRTDAPPKDTRHG